MFCDFSAFVLVHIVVVYRILQPFATIYFTRCRKISANKNTSVHSTLWTLPLNSNSGRNYHSNRCFVICVF